MNENKFVNDNVSMPDLSIYTMDDLIGVDKMVETVGQALADTFTVNGDERPLAQLVEAISQTLGELERLVLGEIVKREKESDGTATDHRHDPPTEGADLRSIFGEPDYVFTYAARPKNSGR